jgi:hypothetical protein
VDGNRVRVLIDAYFYNDKGAGIEGTFKLKLPAGAVPYYFAFGEATYIEEDRTSLKSLSSAKFYNYNQDNFDLSFTSLPNREDQASTREAKIVENTVARDAYFGTRRRQVDPALMEWSGSDMFNCRVYPLLQDQLHHIVVGYDVSMTEAATFREFTLNLPKVSSTLRVDLALADKKLYSVVAQDNPKIASKGDKLHYTYENPKDNAIQVKLNTIAPIALLQGSKDETDYVSGSMRVSLPKIANVGMSPDVVFMLDTSLSSNPQLFEIWPRLMNEVLEQNEDFIKQFAVMTFSIDAKWYKEQYVSNTKANREALKAYVNNLALEGATDLNRALKEASNPKWMGNKSNKNILLLSDGDLNWGNEAKDALLSNVLPGDRIYTFKTGVSGANTDVLSYLSTRTNGGVFSATSGTQLIESAKALRYKTWKIESISSTSARDILLEGGVRELYDGQVLELGARGDLSNPIVIKASSDKSIVNIEFKPTYTLKSDLASRVYGKMAVSQLDNISDDLRSAVVNYSINYRVVSSFTSFLMLESKQDYENYNIKENNIAKEFVADFTVSELLKEYLRSTPFDVKKAFGNWINNLKKQGVLMSDDDVLDEFISGMSVSDLVVSPKNLQFKVLNKHDQTAEEREALGDVDVTFDKLNALTESRAKAKSQGDALKLLSSIIEKNSGDTDVLRDLLTYTMNQRLGYDSYYLGLKVLKSREQDQLVYFNLARALEETNPKLALVFYHIGTFGTFTGMDFGSIKAINGLLASTLINKIESKTANWSIKDKMFIKQLKSQATSDYGQEYTNGQLTNDLVVLVYWNVESTDLDLHINESNGEECYYRNRDTREGGHLSKDVTRGIGPEMYVLPKAKKGKYEIAINYFAQNEFKTKSVAKAYVEIYQDYGTSKQKVIRKTIVLKERKEKEVVETVKF